MELTQKYLILEKVIIPSKRPFIYVWAEVGQVGDLSPDSEGEGPGSGVGVALVVVHQAGQAGGRDHHLQVQVEMEVQVQVEMEMEVEVDLRANEPGQPLGVRVLSHRHLGGFSSSIFPPIPRPVSATLCR